MTCNVQLNFSMSTMAAALLSGTRGLHGLGDGDGRRMEATVRRQGKEEEGQALGGLEGGGGKEGGGQEGLRPGPGRHGTACWAGRQAGLPCCSGAPCLALPFAFACSTGGASCLPGSQGPFSHLSGLCGVSSPRHLSCRQPYVSEPGGQPGSACGMAEPFFMFKLF